MRLPAFTGTRLWGILTKASSFTHYLCDFIACDIQNSKQQQHGYSNTMGYIPLTGPGLVISRFRFNNEPIPCRRGGQRIVEVITCMKKERISPAPVKWSAGKSSGCGPSRIDGLSRNVGPCTCPDYCDPGCAEIDYPDYPEEPNPCLADEIQTAPPVGSRSRQRPVKWARENRAHFPF